MGEQKNLAEIMTLEYDPVSGEGHVRTLGERDTEAFDATEKLFGRDRCYVDVLVGYLSALIGNTVKETAEEDVLDAGALMNYALRSIQQNSGLSSGAILAYLAASAGLEIANSCGGNRQQVTKAMERFTEMLVSSYEEAVTNIGK
jgi:hypothetical protein